MNECSFCECPKDIIVFQTELSSSSIFLKSIKPGHLVVFPKRHVVKIIELNSEEIKDLFLLIQRLATTLNNKLSEEKLYILSIGDKDPHFHFHLIPRLKDETKLGPYIFGETGWRSNFLNYLLSSEQEEIKNYIIHNMKRGEFE